MPRRRAKFPCHARVKYFPRCRPSGPTCCIFPPANRASVHSYRTGGRQKCSKSARKAGTDTWGNYCELLPLSAETICSRPRRPHTSASLRLRPHSLRRRVWPPTGPRNNRILRVPPHPLPMISFCLPQAQIQADLINSLLMGGSVSGLRDNTPCPAVVLYALSSASHIQMRARPSPVRGLSGLSKTRKRRS